MLTDRNVCATALLARRNFPVEPFPVIAKFINSATALRFSLAFRALARLIFGKTSIVTALSGYGPHPGSGNQSLGDVFPSPRFMPRSRQIFPKTTVCIATPSQGHATGLSRRKDRMTDRQLSPA
jgi:hypothetical protein